MKQWWVKYKTNASEGKEPGQGVLDACGRTLFKPATKSAYENNLASAEGLPDVLSKADLYLAVEPSKRSKSKLTRWVGQRGVESKLEKAHHAIANYANGGMRNSLADNLSLAGIALYNLSIRERIKIDRMSADEQAKIPYAFRGVPAHTNHSRLHYMNQLSREAIGKDVHDYVEPELGPNTGEKFFSEYNAMQIQRNASIAPHPETDRCMCHLCGTGPALLRNPYTGTPLNAAQSKELDVAMLPAVSTKNPSARGSQVDTQGNTTLQPILPSMREAMLNQQHAAVFEQQRSLLAEFGQRINYQRATIAALPFVVPAPPICWQSWPRNILRRPKEEQNRCCCNSYLRYMLKKRNPLEPPVMGKPPHDSECTRPASMNNSEAWIYFYNFIYTPTITQLLLLSKIGYSLLATNICLYHLARHGTSELL
jgi:hypothetical protein